MALKKIALKRTENKTVHFEHVHSNRVEGDTETSKSGPEIKTGLNYDQ